MPDEDKELPMLTGPTETRGKVRSDKDGIVVVEYGVPFPFPTAQDAVDAMNRDWQAHRDRNTDPKEGDQ